MCRKINASKAFTLAETMIVLIVLGVVAAITIPGLVRRQIEAANRAKIKKSMTVYDYVMNKMAVENNLKSDANLTSYAGNALNNCKGSSPYFKKAEGSGCRFKTSDGVWWDISDILNPTIALSEDDLDNPDAATTFNLKAWFDENGTLRIDELLLAIGDDKIALQKLYDYLNSKSTSSSEDASLPQKPIPLKSCDQYYCTFYDEDGNMTGQNCNSDGTGCYYHYSYIKNGNQIIQVYGYGGTNCSSSNIGACTDKWYSTYDENMKQTGSNCNSDGTECYYNYSYTKNGNQIIQVIGYGGTNCSSSNIDACTSKYYSTYDDNMNQTGLGCKADGTGCYYNYSYIKNGNQIIKARGNGGTNCSSSNIGACTDKWYSTYDENMKQTGAGCNSDGTECDATYTVTYRD